MLKLLLRDLAPFTSKMNPFDGTGNNLKYLIATGMFSRCLVGLTRIIADAPVINPNQYSDREKTRNFFERIFIEVGGTFLGTFVALHACMDVASKGFAALDPHLAPKQLLEKVKPHLDTKSYERFTRVVTDTFATPLHHLDKPRNVLFQAVYGNANLHHFRQQLQVAGLGHMVQTHQGHLVGKTSQDIGAYFKRLNQRSALVVLAGVLGSAYISGAPIQWMNDHWLRQGLGPWLLTRLYGKDASPSAQSASVKQPMKQDTLPPSPLMTAPLPVSPALNVSSVPSQAGVTKEVSVGAMRGASVASASVLSTTTPLEGITQRTEMPASRYIPLSRASVYPQYAKGGF